MTKYDYLTLLKQYLSPLPPKERVDAVNYYDKYFSDAGPENEQRIMERLGPPKELARRIIKSSRSTFPGMVSDTKNTVKTAARRTKADKNGNRSCLAGAAVFLIYMIIMGVLIVILGLIAVAAVGLLAAAFGLGTAVLMMSVPYLFSDTAIGLTAMGLGLVLIGLPVLVFMPVMNFVFFIIKKTMTGAVSILNARVRGKAAKK